jgi:hypothetical protein
MDNKSKLIVIKNRALNNDIKFYSETKSVKDFQDDTTMFLQTVSKQVAEPVLNQLETQLKILIDRTKPLYQPTKIVYENRINVDPAATRQEKTRLTRIATKNGNILQNIIYEELHKNKIEPQNEYENLVIDALEKYYGEISDTDVLANYVPLNNIPRILNIVDQFNAGYKDTEIRNMTLSALKQNNLETKNLKLTWSRWSDDNICMFEKRHLLQMKIGIAFSMSYKLLTYVEFMTCNGWKTTKNFTNVEI